MGIDFEEDDGADIVVSAEALKTLTGLAQQQLKLQKRIEKGVDLLEELNKEYRELSEVTVPDAMDEIGMASFKLKNGATIGIEEKMSMSVPKKNKTLVTKWMIDNDLEALISEDIVVPFDKGDHKIMKKLLKALIKNGYETQVTETFNTASLKAAVKDLMNADVEEGEDPVDIPLEMMGGYSYRKATIKTK